MTRVSTIIPTIQRESLIRAVDSVISQSSDPEIVEVIVVNDSGTKLVEAPWQLHPGVKIINTFKKERSVARNAGASISKGDYLHFLDDDDWLLPGGLTDLLALTKQSDADMVVGGTIFVDRTGTPLREFYPDIEEDSFIQTMSGEWIPLQSSLIKSSSFFRNGGFNPQFTGSEDLDLARRISSQGKIYGNPKPVACISMGQTGSTTNWEDHRHQRNLGREILINHSETLKRLRESAKKAHNHRSYWHGKIIRIFLTSAWWNVQQEKKLFAILRVWISLVSLILSIRYYFHSEFWRAILKPHISFAYLESQHS